MAFQKKLYFFALIPPKEVEGQIKRFKEEMKEKFAAKHALKLPAHITLQPPFRMMEEKEKELLEALQNFAAEESAFQVQLENFGSFPPRVIFVKVQDHEPVLRLHKNLRAALKKIVPEEKDPLIHPHLSIASRDLKQRMFKPAWEEFSDRKFEAEFTANTIYLLKHNGKTWEVLKEQHF